MISAIIPCYNEEKRLPPTLSEIIEFEREHPGFISDLVIVDDGSKDATVEKALYYQKKLPQMRIERLVENSGKWAAIHHGIDVVKNDRVLLMDADGSADIWQLENLVNYYGEVLMKEGTAYFGSRFMPESSVEGKNALRTVVSYSYRAYSRFMYRLAGGKGGVPDDMQAPFKLFWKSDITYNLESNRFAGDIELALSLNCEKKSFPIDFIHKAGSKLPAQSAFYMFVDTYNAMKRHRRKKKDYSTVVNKDELLEKT